MEELVQRCHAHINLYTFSTTENVWDFGGRKFVYLKYFYSGGARVDKTPTYFLYKIVYRFFYEPKRAEPSFRGRKFILRPQDSTSTWLPVAASLSAIGYR